MRHFALLGFVCLLLSYVWRRMNQNSGTQRWLLARKPRCVSESAWLHGCQYYCLLPCTLGLLFLWDSWRFFRLLGTQPRLPPFLGEAEREALALPWWLRRLAVFAPTSVLLTLLVSAGHTARQVARQHLTQQRDRTVQVILLPAVYGLFALDSLLCALSVMWGHVGQEGDTDISLEAWHEHVRLRDELYAANFEVADLYEAWALWCFGKICVRHVGLRLRQEGATTELFRPLKSITLLGIQAFVFVYVLKSVYLLSLTVLRSPPFELQVCFAESPDGKVHRACGWERFFSGAGFTASSIALYNIFTFEHNLEPFLHGFKPRWKFLGVKLLVSLAFIQDIALQLLSLFLLGLSVEQRQLLYASLICLEVLAIACLQVHAWNASDSWFTEDIDQNGEWESDTELSSSERSIPVGMPSSDFLDQQDSILDFRTWRAQRQSTSSWRDNGQPAPDAPYGALVSPRPSGGRGGSACGELELRSLRRGGAAC